MIKILGTEASSTQSLLQSLLFYWQFEETSGDAIDKVSATHLTNTDMAYSQTGKVGNCFGYNGTTSYQKLLGSFQESSTAFSVALWFKTSTTGTTMSLVSNLNVTTGFNIHIESNNIELYIGNTFDHIIAYTVTDGAWHHFAFTYDGTTVRPYFDGSATTSYAFSAYATGNSDAFFAYDGSYTFTGLQDEFGIWNKTLTATEVTTLNNKSYPF
jgi:hypothetical protein